MTKQLNDLRNAIGKYVLKMGEQWRCNEGAEIMDAYQASDPLVSSSSLYTLSANHHIDTDDLETMKLMDNPAWWMFNDDDRVKQFGLYVSHATHLGDFNKTELLSEKFQLIGVNNSGQHRDTGREVTYQVTLSRQTFVSWSDAQNRYQPSDPKIRSPHRLIVAGVVNRSGQELHLMATGLLALSLGSVNRDGTVEALFKITTHPANLQVSTFKARYPGKDEWIIK